MRRARGSAAGGDRGAGARGLRGGDARAAGHPSAPGHDRRAGRVGADLVQPRARAGGRARGAGLHAPAAADLHGRRHRGLRRLVGVVRDRGLDRRAHRSAVRAGARRRVGAARLPRAPGEGVRRTPRRRGLGHGRRGRHGDRTGGGRAAHAGDLVAGDLRGAGAVRGAGGAGRARRARGTGGRPGPAPSGDPPQPDPRAAVGRAHGGAVPDGPAAGGGLGSLTGGRGADGVRRGARGAPRGPDRPAAETTAAARGRGGLLPDRGRTGRRSRSCRRPTSPGRSRPRHWWASDSA